MTDADKTVPAGSCLLTLRATNSAYFAATRNVKHPPENSNFGPGGEQCPGTFSA